MMKAGIDFDRLLKLRLVVARIGEMDLAKWWNTRGQLGRLGGAAIRRGFPRTHYFAQARSVFAVADFRCSEVFDPPQSVTLWRLPESVEEEFQAHWERCLDQADTWKAFFLELEALKETEVKTALQSFDLITHDDSELFSRLRRSAEGRAVPLPAPFTGTNQDIASLALGFGCGEPGALAVPYARVNNT
ncbi:BrxE family protein [Rhizobium leguminosarum bv. viciae]|uniref:BrxE family protein n=1 Tax=Rhizobium leguminosarum bv. viciae TaxID=387 RepID=A0A8I2GNM1_RHILV|nr:BrxE family protein [Rhizobium leguminosarum]NKM43417.1 BrxE family protein [Rhizobium leguminosarum bv. viciae]